MEARVPGGAAAMINDILEKAVKLDASDVHVEPGENNVRVRYRVDGLLQNGILIHRTMLPQLVSRIKIMAELDISEQRLPQDGRTFVKLNGQEYDLRVSTMPLVHGEKAVIRILDRRKTTMRLEDLGMTGSDLATYRKEIENPHGLIIVSGPTGCGKTTTLYASLEKLDKEKLNITTLEDPVEYSLSSINQIPVNNKSGLTFARALRSVLRQDPDVIMVGEIRDAETASIAVRAAMTGHLVFSTIHTNDAAGAVVRMIDMGVEPFLISSALKCVISQRLVRVTCSSCRGSGCRTCSQTGFKGRTGIFELLKVDERTREALSSGASSEQISGLAGVVSMRENAMSLVSRGITTIDEVVRNVNVE